MNYKNRLNFYKKLPLLLILFSGAALQAQNISVTIGNDTSTTSTSYYAPFGNAFRNALVEMVYPGELIGSAGRIDTIAFSCSTLNPTYSITDYSLKIYIGHTSDTSLAGGFIGRESLQLVFSAANIVHGGPSGWESFALQHPYWYEGTDNLVIVVERTASAFSWNINYHCSSAPASCRYAYSDTDPAWASVANPPTGSILSDSRPNLRLSIDTAAAAPCAAAPSDVILTDIGDEYLHASIIPNVGDSLWCYSYGAMTDTANTVITTANTQISLSGLRPGTLYYLVVRTLCANGDTSQSHTCYFHTQCAPYEALDTFFTAFEMSEGYQTGRGNLRNCWTVGCITDSTRMPYVNNWLESDARYLTIDGGRSVTEREWPLTPLVETHDSAYAILPDILFDGGIDNYRLNFTLQKGQLYYSDTLQVGIITDPSDFSTFHLVAEIAATTTATPHEVPLNSYTGPEGNLVFLGRCTPGAANQDFEFDIDSVRVSPLPPCIMPTGLAIDAIDTASVTLSWTAPGYESQWQVRYRIAGSSNWTTVMAFSNPFAVTGLSDAASYEFSVRAYCNATHTSQWTNSVACTTSCRLVSIYPWTETFDSGLNANLWSPACWNNSGDLFYVSNTSIGGNNTPHIYAYWHEAELTLPTFRFHHDSLYIFRLAMLRRSPSSSYDDAGVYVIVNSTDTLAFIHEVITEAPFESSGNSWCFYDFPIPRGGDTVSITLKTQHGDGIAIDNLSVRVAPSCIMPNAPAADSVTGSSAHITWSTLGSESLWQLRYRTDDDTAWTLIDSVTATSHTITSLQSSTKYEVQVRAVCGDTVGSEWSWPVQFNTYCAPITDFAWSEDFQSAGTSAWLPSCWERVLSHNVNNLIFKTGSFDAAHTRVLYILTNDSSVDTSAVSNITLPPFEIPAGSYHFSLDMYRYSYLSRHGDRPYGGLYVIANSDTLAYIPCLCTQAGTNVGTAASDGWYTYTFAIPHSGFTRITLSAVTRQSDFFIDNLILQRQTSCATPADLAASNVTSTSADISWTGSGSNWMIKYKDADSSFNLLSVTATNVTISGLTPGRHYVAYVRKMCTDGDSSNWAGPVDISTPLFDNSIIIANGTSPTTMPAKGNYANTTLRTQTIYPSSMLSSIVGDTIVALQYFVSSGNNHNTWDNAVYTVKLATTSASTFTGFVASAATVYTGTLTANPEDGMSLVLDNPFVYDGGNLLVEFYLPTSSTASNVSFYGTYRYMSSIYGYGSWINSPIADGYMPKCRIFYSHTYFTAAAVSNDTAMGNVTGGGTHLEIGDVVTFSATANTGCQFSHWSNGSTSSTISVTVTSDTLLTAYFQRQSFAVDAIANDSVMGHVTGGGEYLYGDTVTLSAHPHFGYEFVEWSNGTADSTLIFLATADTSFTAYFQRRTYSVEAVANDSVMGYVVGGGEYHYGDTVTLSAHPYFGYEFVQWDDGVADSILIFLADTDTLLVAQFQPAMAVVSVVNETPEYGTTEPEAGIYEVQVGQLFSVTALPNEGCSFGHWSIGGDSLVTSPSITYEVTAGDRLGGIELRAIFLPPQEGIGEATEVRPIVSARRGEILVSDRQQRPVSIFDSYGRRLVCRQTDAVTIRIPVPASGVYFVRIADLPAQRVVVIR